MLYFVRSGLFQKRWLLLSLSLVLVVAGAFLLQRGHPPVYHLSIYEGRSENLLEQRMVEPGDTILLNYIHSADQTPVSAVFEIHEGGLTLVEEKYSWYGAGLESGAGYDFSFQGEEVTVSGYERSFEELPLRVARTVNQEVYIDDQVISLQKLAPGGTLLILRVDEK